MKKFIFKLLKFSALIYVPLIITLVLYLTFDPFKVIYERNTYFDPINKPNIELNKDFVSTYTFINNLKNNKYDSFIFGNSRSIFYEIKDWKKHIGSSSKCYHFDASGEALYAMHKKILFISKKNVKIKNCLLILDYPTLKQVDSKKGHLSVIAPPLVDYSNLAEFHKTFFEAFISPKFLRAYFDFKINGKVKDYMKEEHLIDDRTFEYDYKTNEMRFVEIENQIKNGTYYTPKRISVFYKRDEVLLESEAIISEKQKNLLIEIQSVFKKNNTNLKVIINPLYDQKKLNFKDLKYLKRLFGENNVFDYSGKNEITEDFHNYYEASHYRPHVTRKIMEEIYQK
ncbi:MAG: hypothetical protein EBQ94_07605 [Flavobacteriales bacterium]|nr:hypothetical protein [Flavobacteriales bacterium]